MSIVLVCLLVGEGIFLILTCVNETQRVVIMKTASAGSIFRPWSDYAEVPRTKRNSPAIGPSSHQSPIRPTSRFTRK